MLPGRAAEIGATVPFALSKNVELSSLFFPRVGLSISSNCLCCGMLRPWTPPGENIMEIKARWHVRSTGSMECMVPHSDIKHAYTIIISPSACPASRLAAVNTQSCRLHIVDVETGLFANAAVARPNMRHRRLTNEHLSPGGLSAGQGGSSAACDWRRDVAHFLSEIQNREQARHEGIHGHAVGLDGLLVDRVAKQISIRILFLNV